MGVDHRGPVRLEPEDVDPVDTRELPDFPEGVVQARVEGVAADAHELRREMGDELLEREALLELLAGRLVVRSRHGRKHTGDRSVGRTEGDERARYRPALVLGGHGRRSTVERARHARLDVGTERADVETASERAYLAWRTIETPRLYRKELRHADPAARHPNGPPSRN